MFRGTGCADLFVPPQVQRRERPQGSSTRWRCPGVCSARVSCALALSRRSFKPLLLAEDAAVRKASRSRSAGATAEPRRLQRRRAEQLAPAKRSKTHQCGCAGKRVRGNDNEESILSSEVSEPERQYVRKNPLIAVASRRKVRKSKQLRCHYARVSNAHSLLTPAHILRGYSFESQPLANKDLP